MMAMHNFGLRPTEGFSGIGHWHVSEIIPKMEDLLVCQ